MQNSLNKQERQRLNSHFGVEGQQNQLLSVCCNIFTLRAGRLEGIKFEAEDLFCQVAWLLDRLFESPTLGQQDIDEMWYRQTQTLRDWPGSTVNDRLLIVDMEFRIVRKLLCHHWDTYYSNWLYGLFKNTIEREGADGININERLSDYGENINDWINNSYDGHLSEIIESVTTGKSAQVIKSRSGRKAKDPKTIVETFDYQPHLVDRGQRLQALFQSLRGRYIDIHTEQKDFIDLFQNTTTKAKVVWIQEIILLKYLILRMEKYLSLPQGFTKWQIVCAHFQIRTKRKEKVENKTDDSYVIIDLQTTQFTKSGELPMTNDRLDSIVRILNPRIGYQEALQEYLDFQQEHDEKMDTDDALSNGLNTDLRV